MAGFQRGVKPYGCDGKQQEISTSFETEDPIEILNYYTKFEVGEATGMLNWKTHSLFLPVQE